MAEEANSTENFNTASAFSALQGIPGMKPETVGALNDIYAARSQSPTPAPATPTPVEGAQPGAPAPTAPVETGAPATAEPTGGEPGTPAPAAPPIEGTPPEPVQVTPPAEEVAIESPLFGGKKIVSPQSDGGEAAKLGNFETIDDFSKFLNEKHGISDFVSLDKKLAEFTELNGKFTEVNTQYENVQTLFKSMPAELYAAVTSFVNGQDWKSAINTSAIDFNKAVTDFKEREIADAMSPGKLSEEDWNEYNDPEGDPAVKRLVKSVIETSNALFESKKSEINRISKEHVQDAQKQQAAYDASLNVSKEFVKTSYPDMSPALLNEIETMFKTPGGLNNLFFNEKGVLLEDAFQRVAMARHGKELVDQYIKINERKVQEKVVQDVLDRGSDTPPRTPKGGSSQQHRAEEIGPEAQAVIDGIKGLVPSKNY